MSPLEQLSDVLAATHKRNSSLSITLVLLSCAFRVTQYPSYPVNKDVMDLSHQIQSFTLRKLTNMSLSLEKPSWCGYTYGFIVMRTGKV